MSDFVREVVEKAVETVAEGLKDELKQEARNSDESDRHTIASKLVDDALRSIQVDDARLSNIGLYALRAIQADDNELDRFAKVIVNNDDLLEVLVNGALDTLPEADRKNPAIVAQLRGNTSFGPRRTQS